MIPVTIFRLSNADIKLFSQSRNVTKKMDIILWCWFFCLRRICHKKNAYIFPAGIYEILKTTSRFVTCHDQELPKYRLFAHNYKLLQGEFKEEW